MRGLIHGSTFQQLKGSFLRDLEGQFSLPFYVVDGVHDALEFVDDHGVGGDRVDVPVDVVVVNVGVALPTSGAQRLSPYPLN